MPKTFLDSHGLSTYDQNIKNYIDDIIENDVAPAIDAKADDSVFGASGANHSKGLVPDPGSTHGDEKFLREDGTWQVPVYQNDVNVKRATALAFEGLVELIPQLAFTTNSHNAAEVINNMNDAIAILNGAGCFITKTLTGCSLLNSAGVTMISEPYVSKLRCTDLCATVTSIEIIMNEVDVTNTAWDPETETISIGSVTGPISITATAAVVLPEGYTQLEYVRATNTQYVNTGVQIIAAKKAVYEVMVEDIPYNKGNHILSNTNHYFPFLRRTSSNVPEIGTSNRGGETITGASSISYPWALDTKYKIAGVINSSNQMEVYVNDEYIFSTNKGTATNDTATLYAFNYGTNMGSNSYRFNGRLYSMNIYGANDIILRRFIPCKNSSDVAGLYDIINDVFYHSGTSTELVAGPEVE